MIPGTVAADPGSDSHTAAGRGEELRTRRRAGGVVAVLCLAVGIAAATGLTRQADSPPVSSDGTGISLARLPVSPLSGRQSSAQVWAGDRLFVWGGMVGASVGDPSRYRADGATLDPVTGTWTSLPTSPLTPRRDAVAVWTGSVIVVAGGRDADRVLPSAAAYDPATDAWSTLPASPNCPQLPAVLGSDVYTYGGCGGEPRFAVLNGVGSAAAAWTALPEPPLRDVHQVLSWHHRLIAVGTLGLIATYTPGQGWDRAASVPEVSPEDVPQLGIAGGTLFAVVAGPPTDSGPDTTVVWRWSAGSWSKAATTPDLPAEGGVGVAAVGDTLVWEANSSICAYQVAETTGSCLVGQVIPPIDVPLISDGDSVFLWGGRGFHEGDEGRADVDLNTGYQITITR